MSRAERERLRAPRGVERLRDGDLNGLDANVRKLLDDLGDDFRGDGEACLRDDEPVEMACAGETCNSRLYSLQGGKDWRLRWSGEPFTYAVDFSQRTPRLLMRPLDCAAQCPEQALDLQASQ